MENLLVLDGESFVADRAGTLWVKFEVKAVEPCVRRPHGLKYSLTLHDEDGHRILGFDNAHPIRIGAGPGAKTKIEYDHKHEGERVRFYCYTDAFALLSDFWKEVESIVQERSL
ncbi:hypothetical protein CAL29_12975 [Bordetella genomosp. 10]|uniref:Uncharacterized protein n=1 Tax=Bordetella genomosp. 10 TaxID=1416804 RepID=A0A261SDC4_9BORD|nr:hypothetical protein CAL29_12975 [Bordetella genomosp. 10]